MVDPKAENHRSDEAERDEPEEKPVRQAAREQSAAEPELAHERLGADVRAGDALARLTAELVGALVRACEAFLERSSGLRDDR
jgi:hypothetical protein